MVLATSSMILNWFHETKFYNSGKFKPVASVTGTKMIAKLGIIILTKFHQ
jgi:hypothetical protein